MAMADGSVDVVRSPGKARAPSRRIGAEATGARAFQASGVAVFGSVRLQPDRRRASLIPVVTGFSRTVTPVVSGFSRTVTPVVSGFSRTVIPRSEPLGNCG